MNATHPMLKTSSRGSALVITLTTVVVVAMLTSYTLQLAHQRYTDIVQAQSWQESMNAAEAAVDTALMALRQQVNDPDNAWNGWTFDQTNPATTENTISLETTPPEIS